MASIQNNVSAQESLVRLSPVFDLRDVAVAFSVTKVTSLLMAQQWHAAGLIKAVGPETNTFFNLVVDPKAPDQREYEAVKKLIPSAVVIGAKALLPMLCPLHLTEAIQLRMFAAISCFPRRRYLSHLGEFEWSILRRDKLAAPFIRTSFDLTYLVPEAALADAWIFGGGVWQPDPDDIDVDFEDGWQEKLMTALKAFGMDEAEARDRINLIEIYGSGQRPPYFVLK